MRPGSVVVGNPVGDQIAAMSQIAEQRLVQKLVPHPAVEAFHKTVLLRLAGRDVVPFDFALGASLQNRVRAQCCPFITDDHPGIAAAFDQLGQFPGHAAARD